MGGRLEPDESPGVGRVAISPLRCVRRSRRAALRCPWLQRRLRRRRAVAACVTGFDVVCVASREDAFPLRMALLVRHLDEDVRLVVTIFDPAMADQVARHDPALHGDLGGRHRGALVGRAVSGSGHRRRAAHRFPVGRAGRRRCRRSTAAGRAGATGAVVGRGGVPALRPVGGAAVLRRRSGSC